MVQWLGRITMSDEVAHQAYLGENPIVDFTYIHKSGRENTRQMELNRAILLAEERRNDKRYKNYEFHIG